MEPQYETLFRELAYIELEAFVLMSLCKAQALATVTAKDAAAIRRLDLLHLSRSGLFCLYAGGLTRKTPLDASTSSRERRGTDSESVIAIRQRGRISDRDAGAGFLCRDTREDRPRACGNRVRVLQ